MDQVGNALGTEQHCKTQRERGPEEEKVPVTDEKKGQVEEGRHKRKERDPRYVVLKAVKISAVDLDGKRRN